MNDSIWPKDHADAIRRAMATEGGHLFVGKHGYSCVTPMAARAAATRLRA